MERSDFLTFYFKWRLFLKESETAFKSELKEQVIDGHLKAECFGLPLEIS